MSKYSTAKKQICFDSVTKLHADLKIRLHYDDLKIKEFFNELIEAYLNKNQHIVNFIEELKEQKQVSSTRRNKNKRASKNAARISDQFGLNEAEIEDIFDILEKEEELYE